MAKQKTRSERKGQKERAARAATHGLPQATPAPLPAKARPQLSGPARAERGARRGRGGKQGLPGGRFPTILRVGIAAALILGALYWLSTHRGL